MIPSAILPERDAPVALFDALTGDVDRPEWYGRASCAQADPDAFFPRQGQSNRQAKRVCAGCDVRAECLEYALENDEEHGVWGGMSDRERRKQRRRAA